MASDTAVTEFTEENAEQTGLSGVEKKKETDILLLQIKKRKRTEKTKVTKLRHELERVCLKDSELTAIESVIEQLWTALEDAQETLEELIAFYVEVGDEAGKKEAIEESESIEKEVRRAIEAGQTVIKTRARKGGEIRDTKTFNLLRNIVSLQVFVDVSRFSPSVINLSRSKNICCGLKKVVAKSRARVYFEQQILALLLVFHQIHNLSRNKFARVLANQPISAPHFFNLQQMFLLRVKLITQGEKRETPTKTCNETMLRDKLKVFVSRISPP